MTGFGYWILTHSDVYVLFKERDEFIQVFLTNGSNGKSVEKYISVNWFNKEINIINLLYDMYEQIK